MRSIDRILENQAEIEEIIREAGEIIRQASLCPGAVHDKEGAANFVTDYDVAVQKLLISRLKALFPDCGFYGEEETEGNSHDGNGLCFYIDPIDGTTNFIFGYHHSCVSVGVADGECRIAGFVYNPYFGEFYSAVRGNGAFLNGKRLAMKNAALSEGIVAFGCARYNESDTDALFAIVKELYLRSLSVRSGGSAALDLCRIASGNNAVYLELKLQPYDYAAASVIIEEAGGVMGQVDGAAITLDAPCSILAGTERAAKEVRRVCEEYMQ